MDYVTLSKRFTIGWTWRQDTYPGVAIAGREGFYLIFKYVSKLAEAVAFATSSFESHAIPKHKASQECELVWRGVYADLAESVTGHPDWPTVQNVEKVWFIARAVIDAVTISIWTGVTIRVGDARYTIPTGMFSRGRVRSDLRELGLLAAGA